MSFEATYNPLDPTVPNVVTAWQGVDVPTGLPNTVHNPDISLLGGTYETIQPIYNCTVSQNQLVPFTGPQQTAWNAKVAADLLASQRAQAQADVTTPTDLGKLERAVADIIINQLNLHTTWENALASAVAGAATLAALKTAVAAITPVPAVTLAQAKTAIINDIAVGGEGD